MCASAAAHGKSMDGKVSKTGVLGHTIRNSKKKTYLVADGGNLLLRDGWVVVNYVGQGTSFHVLHDDPELAVVVAQKRI